MLRSMIVLGLFGLMSLTCFAQTNANATEKKSAVSQATASTAKQFYHLNFVVQEMENDRVINSRSYSMVTSDTGQSSIRADEKVPYVSTRSKAEWHTDPVGVSIDCRDLESTPGGVSLDIKTK